MVNNKTHNTLGSWWTGGTQACGNCRRAHARCNKQRPCHRCVTQGITDTCRDPPKKKRGRRTGQLTNKHIEEFLKHQEQYTPPSRSSTGSSAPSSSSKPPSHHFPVQYTNPNVYSFQFQSMENNSKVKTSNQNLMSASKQNIEPDPQSSAAISQADRFNNNSDSTITPRLPSMKHFSRIAAKLEQNDTSQSPNHKPFRLTQNNNPPIINKQTNNSPQSTKELEKTVKKTNDKILEENISRALQHELSTSELDEMFNHDVGVILCQPYPHVVYWNPITAKKWGYTQNEFEQKITGNLVQLLHPSVRSQTPSIADEVHNIFSRIFDEEISFEPILELSPRRTLAYGKSGVIFEVLQRCFVELKAETATVGNCLYILYF